MHAHTHTHTHVGCGEKTKWVKHKRTNTNRCSCSTQWICFIDKWDETDHGSDGAGVGHGGGFWFMPVFDSHSTEPQSTLRPSTWTPYYSLCQTSVTAHSSSSPHDAACCPHCLNVYFTKLYPFPHRNMSNNPFPYTSEQQIAQTCARNLAFAWSQSHVSSWYLCSRCR